MTDVVELTPITEHGHKLLDELEHRTGAIPFKTDAEGVRTYWLSAVDVGAVGFEAMLDRIDPDWREHLTR
jgi:hypothetical protein